MYDVAFIYLFAILVMQARKLTDRELLDFLFLPFGRTFSIDVKATNRRLVTIADVVAIHPIVCMSGLASKLNLSHSHSPFLLLGVIVRFEIWYLTFLG